MDLYVIPARGGSKRLPGKNIKPFNGKALILHSVDTARQLAPDAAICVTTDDPTIRRMVEEYGLAVPFLRPAELATDVAATDAVLRHAVQFYQQLGHAPRRVVLLQPTSPLRRASDIAAMSALFDQDDQNPDMVLSVTRVQKDVFSTLRTEGDEGWLQPVGGVLPDAETLFKINGSVYIISIPSLLEKPMRAFAKVRKFVMDDVYSVDIDTPFDWLMAETIATSGLIDL